MKKRILFAAIFFASLNFAMAASPGKKQLSNTKNNTEAFTGKHVKNLCIAYYWFNFGGCWYLYRINDDATATPMNYTNYVGTTSICDTAAQNMC